jgi:hypothetical protein
MWYVTFHGVGSNYNIYAYDDSGNLLTTSVLKVSSAPKDLLKKAELRGIGFAPDGDFYVVNSKQDVSQILRFSGKENSDHSRDYKGVFTSNTSVNAIVHPFAYTVDPLTGNVFVSSQDTNLVTAVFGPFSKANPGTSAPVAPALAQIANAKFLDGTFVASAYTNLPAYSGEGMVGITPVSQPQGLDAFPNDGSKVQKSVRGIVCALGNLYVADEPGNALKIYDGTSGAHKGDITVTGPVHLLCVGSKLYVGCSGDKKASPPVSPSVVCCDLNTRGLSTVVSDGSLSSVSGISFGADGNFYVADRTAQRILRYAPTATPFTPLGIFINSQSNNKDGLPDEPEFLLYVSYGIAG